MLLFRRFENNWTNYGIPAQTFQDNDTSEVPKEKMRKQNMVTREFLPYSVYLGNVS